MRYLLFVHEQTEILEELPKLTKTERQEIRLRIAELDGEVSQRILEVIRQK
jgi:hypothetical protein